MENALTWLIGDLTPEETERFQQWKRDDAGCDLIAFMDGLDSNETLIWALQEVYLAERDRKEYVRRMEVVRNYSLAAKALMDLPHWID